MTRQPVICIGAGPAGLTAAYLLSGEGWPVTVLEQDGRYVGGISRTEVHGGYRFDIGGHRFFSKSPQVNALWHAILGEDFLVRPRKSRIFYRGKFYPYPLNLRVTLANLGVAESALCALSYLRYRLLPLRAPKHFEGWVTNKFGARLFRIFFKTYTEKVWGMSCREISADWAAQRIKGLSLGKAVREALRGGKRRGCETVKSLIQEFFYPRLGPGMMWEAAAARIRAQGGQVTMGARVESLTREDGGWRVGFRLEDGSAQTAWAAHVVSSMPLSALVHAVRPPLPQEAAHAASGLRYRDFIVVGLMAQDRGMFDDQWLYIHDPGLQVGRIQNFKSWSPDMVPEPGMTCYGMEYFCAQGDGLWDATDDTLIALATRELEALGLAARGEVKRGVVIRQPKAYPVYDGSYRARVETIRQALALHAPGMHVVGRNGMHKYNNQDHAMMTALLAVENIKAGHARFDVWRVNEDALYHEEGSAAEGASGLRAVPLPLE